MTRMGTMDIERKKLRKQMMLLLSAAVMLSAAYFALRVSLGAWKTFTMRKIEMLHHRGCELGGSRKLRLLDMAIFMHWKVPGFKPPIGLPGLGRSHAYYRALRDLGCKINASGGEDVQTSVKGPMMRLPVATHTEVFYGN